MKHQNRSEQKQRPAGSLGAARKPRQLIGDVIIAVAGVFVILLGVVLLFLPGPGLLLIAIGAGMIISRLRRFWDSLSSRG
ncbi:MAG: hypothetical protein JSU65_02075 [Candidatus Zixiibacteriota bacterium]|nr:MAG: hypothetical protein JSU65_02075 [candidate division Zixibacteria bacterium]